MKDLLQKGETAVAGTQQLPGSDQSWDAVFAQGPSGTRLIAYVDGSHIAEFFARCLNYAPGLVLDLHEQVYLSRPDLNHGKYKDVGKAIENRRKAIERAVTFMEALSLPDLEDSLKRLENF